MFDFSNVTSKDYMFNSSGVKIVYCRTQADADILSASSGKPAGMQFVVKG